VQYYSAKIRLGGSVLHEVRKTGLSAAEVVLLRREHGADAVMDLVLTDDRHVTETIERARLAAIYGEKKVEAVYGAPDMPNRMPVHLAGFGPDDTPAEPVAAAAPKRVRRTKEQIAADQAAVAAESKTLETVLD
jgi:hypothetical protein